MAEKIAFVGSPVFDAVQVIVPLLDVLALGTSPLGQASVSRIGDDQLPLGPLAPDFYYLAGIYALDCKRAAALDGRRPHLDLRAEPGVPGRTGTGGHHRDDKATSTCHNVPTWAPRVGLAGERRGRGQGAACRVDRGTEHRRPRRAGHAGQAAPRSRLAVDGPGGHTAAIG